MNPENKSQLRQRLHDHRYAIADRWQEALEQTGFLPRSAAEMRQHLVELTDQAIILLLAESFEHGQAEAIGTSLARLRYTDPEAIDRTQEILAQQLVEGLPADQVVALQPRLAALLGGVAAGFSRQVREVILTEQEQIRHALTTALQQAQEALRKAYYEVEQQVQERTAELRDTNESLQREITERKRMEEALRDAARQWHATFDAISDTICLLDLEGKVLRCNKAMTELTGKPFSEIIGHPCWELMDGTPEPIAGCPVERMKETLSRETLVLRRGDRWFDASADPVLNGNDNLIGAVHITADITERKRAEEALRESEERYRSLFEGVPVGLYRTTADGHFLNVNRAMLKMLDYPDQESLQAITTADLQPIATPEERQRRQAVLERDGAMRDAETQLRRRDGATIWTRSNFRAVHDADGRVVGYEGSVEDITERKQMEEALRESEERFRGIFENATIGLYRTTPDGRILMANPALLRMMGYSSFDELAQRNLEENGYEPGYPRSAFKQHIESEGRVCGLESAWIRHDGATLFIRESARIFRDEAGNPLYYEGTVEDITERKRAEEALQKAHDELEMRVQERTAELAQANESLQAEIAERKRAEEELRDREATMRALLNAPIEAATLVDTSGTILAANTTTAKRFERSVDELVGLCIYDLWPPAVAKFRKVQVDKIFLLGTPMRFEDEHEGRSFDHSLYPVFDAQGKVARIAVYIRDITHRKQAEDRIRAYQERLRSLASQLSLTEERERRRIATALHDRVGQTLAICKIKLGPLRRSASSTDLAEPLDEIHQYIEEIIRDTRSLTFELSSPILYQLGLEAAVEWLTEQAWERDGIPSKFQDDRQPKPLDDDVSVLLFQAVRELLINVVKHAQAQSVEVSMQRVGGHVQISVEDDGVGFYALPISPHWSEIKGFGLFSIRERLDHLGGQLKINSQPGQGTQVTLVAPLRREETSHLPSPP